MQRDVTPEQSAAKLRELSNVHYTEQADKETSGVSSHDALNGVNGQ